MKHNYAELATVVRKLKGGDQQAFSRLYELTYQKLYFFILGILKNEADAQDALQETYIKIYSNLHTLEDEKLFVAWANKIAYNISIRMLSKNKAILPGDEVLHSIPADSSQSNPEVKVTRASQKMRLAAAIESLPPISRSVLVLKYFEGLKLSQIAEIMDCPVGTVKSRLNTAKKTLKKILKKERKGDLLFQFITFLGIKKALSYIAADSALKVHAADAVFEGVITSVGLPEALTFAPQAAALPTAATTELAAKGTAAVAGGTAAVALGSILLSSPAFVSVNVHIPETPYTRDPVIVTAELEAPFNSIREVYARSHETSQITYGTLGEDKIARFSLTDNGEYTFYAVDSNNKEATITATISCIDRDLPVLKDYSYTNDSVIFYLEDSLSGVDYSSIYGETVSGSPIYPTQVDEASNKLVFAFPKENFYLYIRDFAGNESKYSIEPYIE